MRIDISFQEMEHSVALEEHARAKLGKLEDLLGKAQRMDPCAVSIRFKQHLVHPHGRVECHLKTPEFDLHTHHEGPDLCFSLDSAIDKMVALFKKEKSKLEDRSIFRDTDKAKFSR